MSTITQYSVWILLEPSQRKETRALNDQDLPKQNSQPDQALSGVSENRRTWWGQVEVLLIKKEIILQITVRYELIT